MKLLSVCFLCCLMLTMACSKDTPKQESSKNTTPVRQQVIEPVEPNYDSLAQIIHPVRNPNNQFVTLVTDSGNMVLELFRDVAPAHADSFMVRTLDGFYNKTKFYRIIRHYMIQGGDPAGTGFGHAGYTLKAEFSNLPHKEGTLSMARGRDIHSASCQFFICLERNRMTQRLDKAYTVFGQLVSGYDALHRIGSAECVINPQGEKAKPVEPIYVERFYRSDSLGNEI